MACAAFCSDANLSSGEREDRSKNPCWIFLPLLTIGLLSGFLPAYTERKGWGFLTGSSFAGSASLFTSVVAHCGLRPPSSAVVPADWWRSSPDISWATDGIYGVVRHPSYLGLIIMGLGWALTFRSGIGVFLAGLVIPPLDARIRSEEALLRSQFGEQYDSYSRRTSRLIPGIY